MFIRLALLLLLALLPAVPALAAEKDDPIGVVVALEGEAQKKTPHGIELLVADDPVYLNEVIETGPQSKILILLIDDSQIILGNNSAFALSEYIFDPADESQTFATFETFESPFLFYSGWIAKSKNPDIRMITPHAIATLRGPATIWGGRFDIDYGLHVREGTISVENNTGSVLVQQGQGVYLRNSDIRPSEIGPWGEERLTEALNSVTLQDMPRIEQRLMEQKRLNLQRRRDHADRLKERREARQLEIAQQRGEIEEEDITSKPLRILQVEMPDFLTGDGEPDPVEQKRAQRQKRQQEWVKKRP